MSIDSNVWMRPLGLTGLEVSAVCLGGSPLGSEPHNYGHSVSTESAVELVAATFGSPITMIDTSNGYSHGDSERRIGMAVTKAGGLPDGFLVSTKVDARNGDFSATRVRDSVRESCERLGLNRLPLVYLHDPEFHNDDALMGPGGAVEGLLELKNEGIIDHLGVAGGRTDVLGRYLDLNIFEVVLSHNRWTLVDRSAGELFRRAHAAGIGVANAAIYGGGILAAPHGTNTKYAYGPAQPILLQAVSEMANVCEKYDTDLATASLQFSLRTSVVDTTVIGMSSTQKLTKTLTNCGKKLPPELFEELETLTPPPETWLDSNLI